MVKEEWKKIFHNHWMKIVLVAIILIPSIYTTVFLGSMWDPYGHTEDIPVVIVNNDQSVNFGNKKLSVGDELVRNLKNNQSMNFCFENQQVALDGLKEGRYYMMITIPSDFSNNATTLLNEKPQKMMLEYTTNPGTNYIASKMDDSAIEKIKSEVSNTITKTYAETVFSQISILSQGLQKASDGTTQLSSGMNQVIDGNQKIKDNLNVLASSSLVFKNGVTTFQKGLNDYLDGFMQVHQGANQLDQGLTQVNQSSQALSNAMNQLKDGSTQLSSGLQDYSQGLSKASEGMNALVSQNDILLSSSQKLADGVQKLDDKNKLVVNGFNEYNASIQKMVQAQADVTNALYNAQLSNLSDKWLKGTLTPEEAQRIGFPAAVQFSYFGYLKELSKSFDLSKATDLAGSLGKVQEGLGELDKSEQEYLAGINKYMSNTQEIQEGLNQIHSYSSSLNQGSQSLTQGLTELSKQTPVLIQGMKELNTGSNQLVKGTQTLAGYNQQLKKGVQDLSNGASQISQGAYQLADGSTSLQNGLIKVQDGTGLLGTQLNEGAQKSQLNVKDETYDMFAQPVETNHKEISVVENNGHAMAPYMMSVALYVAGLAFTLMYPVLEGSKESKSGFQYWLSKATVAFGVSTLSAIVMIMCLSSINGLHPQHLLETYLFAILVSAAFMALILFLNVTTGYIGEFLLLVFMIINLGGSAGTYPIETSSPFFQLIHPFVPYTYSVDGFRKVISIANASITNEVLVFIGILIVFSLLTILYYHYCSNDKHLIPQAFEKHE